MSDALGLRPGFGGETAAFVVAMQDYEINRDERRLDGLVDQARQLADALTAGGTVRLSNEELISGGSSSRMRRALRDYFANANSEDRLILYWAGHGITENFFYLATKDSPTSGLDSENSVPISMLVELIAKSPAEKVLVVLDTCYSAHGAVAFATAMSTITLSSTAEPGRQRCLHLIATANAFDPRVSGVASECLTGLLLDESSKRREWGDLNEFISCDALTVALASALREKESHSELVAKRHGFEDRFIPNPRFRGDLPPVDVETKRHLLRVEEHFLLSARGVEVNVTGWYFTGRRRLLHDLVEWSHQPGPGLRVLTGQPGAGKSAVIGRLVSLIHPTYRSRASLDGAPFEDQTQLETVPVVVHAKGRSVTDVAGDIAAQLDLRDHPASSDELASFLAAVSTLPGSPIIVVDALDEAAVGDRSALARLLRELAHSGDCRVLVGSRRRVDPRPAPPDADRHEQLRSLFGAEAEIDDLEDEPDSDEDIAKYVVDRLAAPSSPHRDHAALDEIGRSVADKAGGSFLYARLVAWTLFNQTELDAAGLPVTAVAALSWDLESRLEAEDLQRAEALLAALAWARGGGLTRAVWPAFANAVADRPGLYQQPDVAWALDQLGWHIIEASEDQETVYRLAHQSFADDFQVGHDPVAIHRRIVEQLTSDVSGAGWLHTDRYLWRHLSDHALAADRLGQLLHDPGYLAVAEPIRLSDTLKRSQVLGEEAIIAGIYLRTWRALPPLPPDERAATIELVATRELQHADQQSLLRSLAPPIPGRWRALGAVWQPSAVHENLKGHTGGVDAVAVGQIAGRDVVVSGGFTGRIRVEDPTGERPATLLEGHTWSVDAVAVGQIAGRDVIVSGSGDDTVRVWDPTGERPATVLKGHTGGVKAVALGQIAGRDVIVSGGDDRTVRLWDPTGERPATVLEGHTNLVNSLAVGQIAGRDVIVSGSFDGTVRLWDPTGERPATVLEGNPNLFVYAVAVGQIGGRDVIVYGGGEATVRVWDPTGDRPVTVLKGHTGSVSSVAVGQIAGRDVIVSGSFDDTVRVWDPTGDRPATLLEGHTRLVKSVAVGQIAGRDVIVSGGGDGTVRVWDPTGDRPATLLEGHTRLVKSVAVGQIAGRDVIVPGSQDGTLGVWDPTGKRPIVLLKGHTQEVSSVAVGQIAGRDVIVSGAFDRTVRVWDPTGDRPATVLKGHTRLVSSVAVGQVAGRDVIVSGSFDDTVRVWDPTGERPATVLKGHTGSVSSVAVGQIAGRDVIVSGSFDDTVRVWDPTGERPATVLKGHTGSVKSVAVGQIVGRDVIVSGSRDGTVRVWDPTTTRRSFFRRVRIGKSEIARWNGIDVLAFDPAQDPLYAALVVEGSIAITALDVRTPELLIPGGVVPTCVALSGRILAIGADQGVVAIQLDSE